MASRDSRLRKIERNRAERTAVPVVWLKPDADGNLHDADGNSYGHVDHYQPTDLRPSARRPVSFVIEPPPLPPAEPAEDAPDAHQDRV